jgi:acyl carrier protein
LNNWAGALQRSSFSSTLFFPIEAMKIIPTPHSRLSALVPSIRMILRKRFYAYVPGHLRLSHSLATDFGLTYAEICELTNDLEDVTGLDVASADLSRVQTVGDLVREFQKQMPANPRSYQAALG